MRNKNLGLSAIVLVVAAMQVLPGCMPEPEFPATEHATQAPEARSGNAVCQSAIAVYSWADQAITVQPARREFTRSHLGARELDATTWEIEHPTQGWLEFSVTENADVAAVAEDDPDIGDEVICDSSKCEILTHYLDGSCIKTSDTTAKKTTIYGISVCRDHSSITTPCHEVYNYGSKVEYFSDTTCTNLDRRENRAGWACEVDYQPPWIP